MMKLSLALTLYMNTFIRQWRQHTHTHTHTHIKVYKIDRGQNYTEKTTYNWLSKVINKVKSCFKLTKHIKFTIYLGGYRFSGNDSRGAQAPPVTIIVRLCNCSGPERGQCVWNQLQDGYFTNISFQVVACNCNGTYVGQYWPFFLYLILVVPVLVLVLEPQVLVPW